MGFEKLSLAVPHRDSIMVGGVIPSENVQDTVNDE